MNKIIQELEDQCWIQVPCDFDMRKGGLSTINTVFDRKKFAELIVRECIRLCDQVDIVGADECIDNIKEHFEVKQ